VRLICESAIRGDIAEVPPAFDKQAQGTTQPVLATKCGWCNTEALAKCA
jgi:hypothetical protein